MATGCLDYFPDALAEVARVSVVGNRQHNLGPLVWDKSKSTDEADALLRHLAERGKLDTDGTRHSAKVAWRALALLQREIDAAESATLAERVGGVVRVTRDFGGFWAKGTTCTIESVRANGVRVLNEGRTGLLYRGEYEVLA